MRWRQSMHTPLQRLPEGESIVEPGVRICAIGLLIGVSAATAAVSAQAPGRGSGPLALPGPTRVVEADTFEVWANGTRFAVAVAGITAPAGNTSCGREAIERASELVAGPIWLDEDAGLPSFDARHRRIYRVTTSSGLSLAVELALAGMVQAKPSHQSAADYPAIVAGQTEAESAHRGCLWSGDSRTGR